jgi:hypothetical protein
MGRKIASDKELFIFRFWLLGNTTNGRTSLLKDLLLRMNTQYQAAFECLSSTPGLVPTKQANTKVSVFQSERQNK